MRKLDIKDIVTLIGIAVNVLVFLYVIYVRLSN
jgi:hypothetical protein